MASKRNTYVSFGRFAYLKLALLATVAGIAAYALNSFPLGNNGGTWLGYTLGTVGALIILLLLAFGIRKRSYRSNLGTVQHWLSAHIYLGVALIPIVTLHTGFHFGYNVHTLAYVLMMAVIATGAWGMLYYARYPILMGQALQGETFEQHALALAAIDSECRTLAMNLPDHLNRALLNAANAPLFDHFLQRFSGKNRHCKTAAVIALLSRSIEKSTDGDARVIEGIYTRQLQKLARIRRMREYIRLKTGLEFWLLFHVPLAMALLAALTAHIVSVFYYW